MPGISITYRKNIPDPIAIPKEHIHDSDVDFPVLAFDFNLTLTPSEEYPIDSPPYPGVVDVLQTFKRRGCCLHITTAGLYLGTQDIPVFQARQKMLYEWCTKYDIPIGFAGGKVPSDAYIDNDAVNVPLKKSDWDVIATQIEARLASRFTLKNGTYVPTPHQAIGRDMPDPVPTVEALPPRGYSSARLDIDFHKTLYPASSSQRYSPPDPDGLKLNNAFYTSGYTIRHSCAGWSPLSHPKPESDERYRGLVWQEQKYGSLYDRIVTKDFHHVITDDKAVPFMGDWEAVIPLTTQMLDDAGKASPGLQWPA